MKKISKIALVAVVAAMTAFFGCNSEPSILEKVAPVSDLQAKAFPGLNVVTWKPNAVSNGYTLFADYGRGWEFVDSFDNDKCSHWDFISTDNEWLNGQEVKYMIQNDGDKLARAAYVNKELVSSDFVEVSVKAVNPGYKEPVMYKMPALEEGQATPDFNSVDYFDAEAIAAFVDPAFTIKEREPKAPLVTFVKAPGLEYALTVRSADETEKDKINFAFNEDDTELSALGNAELITPFIGQNDVWVTISDANDYYSPVEYKIGSFTNTVEGAADAWNAEFAMARDTDEEEADVYKLTWNAITVDNVKSLDGVYYLYSEISNSREEDNWEKVEFTYSYDELIGKYVAYLPFNKKEVNKEYKLFAVYNGKTVGSDNANYNSIATTYKNTGLNLRYVVTEKYDFDTTDAEDLKNAKIILAWDPVKRFVVNYEEKVATDVTYKITKQEIDLDTREMKDEEITSVGTINAYNSYNDCITTAPFDVKNNYRTTYKVYAYDPEGNLLGSDSVTYDTDLVSQARNGYVNFEERSTDKKSVTFKGETYLDDFGKEVKHTYKLFVIDASLNTNGFDRDAAKEVTLTPTYEAVADQSYQKVTLTASGLSDKVTTYNYWLFDVTKQEEGLPATAYRSGSF